MERYDPLKAPKAEEWLALDEEERLALVRAYHRKMRPPVPNLDLHASLHVTVENQAALGDETPVRRTLARLMRERVDRHEAVHAVATMLIENMRLIALGEALAADANGAYFASLEKLTIADWRRDFG